jgi:DNA end-binding protein Ku
MTALQQSLKGGSTPDAKAKKPKAATGQRVMLLPISGKKAPAKKDAKTPPVRQAAKSRKAS